MNYQICLCICFKIEISHTIMCCIDSCKVINFRIQQMKCVSVISKTDYTKLIMFTA